MKARHLRHWAAIGESTCVGGLWFMYGVHRLLGRLPMRLLAYPVVAYYWATRAEARRASLEYLQRMQAAHGVLGREPGWREGLRHFFSFAETILDKLLAASGRYRLDTVRFVGQDALLALQRQGRGAVLVVGHIGCLEMCQSAAARQPGLRLTVLVHTRHAERFNRVLRRLDPDNPVRLLQVTEVDAATAVLLAERVAAGEFVAIAGDRTPVSASKTATVPFLGHGAPFPVGAYVLASLMRCPVFMMGCVREATGHVVVFERLTEQVVLPRGRRNEALTALATEFAAWTETLLQRAPYDWFNFFSFWAQPPASTGPRRTAP